MTDLDIIETHEDLRKKIGALHQKREMQEEVLSGNLKWLYESLKPNALLETAIENLKDEEESVNEATHLSIDYLTKKYLGTSKTFRGSIGAMVMNEALHFAYNRYQKQVRGFFRNSARNLAEILTPKRRRKS